MATTDRTRPVHREPPVPGDGPAPSRMPGHWLLARLGKRVLRPGGVELTGWMLDSLELGGHDRVVELAAGLGATAPLTLARGPAAFAAVARPGALAAPGPTEVCAVRADAADTGLPAGSADVVYGEAVLTMQPYPAKRRVVREARRLLDGVGGRYALHEMCLLPDGLDADAADRIAADLREAVHVGTRPLTPAGWSELLAVEGFTVTARRTVPMALLQPRRLVADEGLVRALGIAGRALRDPASRRRVMHMRRVFRRHRAHLGAISLVAVPTPSQP
ncbi:class I SAM-dependent methyltransferase [Streptomyces sp. MK5]|uniref:class I SAM-dependent methyltransferase n=1 Tax=Streptomyces sp. MK5 TaxID=3064253 RepID=UPI0027425E4D|nr:class I SAM-dependent methyltransferase [Streptomyces sp. MK5]